MFKWSEECEENFQELMKYLGQAPLLSKPKEGEALMLYLVVLTG